MAQAQVPLSDSEKAAVRALKAGQQALAEMLAWDALQKSEDSATALSVLGAIALDIGLPDAAVGFFRRATAIDPHLPNLDENRATAERIAGERNRNEPFAAVNDGTARYLLIKPWGYGLWSDAGHVAVCALLAELTQRTPVVHWGAGSQYNDRPPADCFAGFFEPLSDVTVDDLASLADATIFPAWWRVDNLPDAPDRTSAAAPPLPASHYLARDETVAVIDHYTSMAALRGWVPEFHRLKALTLYELWQRQLQTVIRPLPEYRQRARAYINAEFRGQPFIAVHCRDADRPGTAEGDRYLDWVDARMAALTDEWGEIPVFVQCDHPATLHHFRTRHGARIHANEDAAGDAGRDAAADKHDRRAAGAALLTDTLIAHDSVAFIGPGASDLSGAIAHFRPWPPGRCLLFGRPEFETVNLAVYGGGQQMPQLRLPRLKRGAAG